MSMKQVFWTERRIAGSLMAGSLPIIVLALIIWIGSGALPVSSTYLRGGFAQAAPYIDTFRLLFLLSGLGWIVQALGLSLLARLLLRAGSGQLAVLAFTLVLAAVVLAILWATFRMSIELWAVQEAARTGNVPELFAPLQAWSNGFFRFAYVANLVAGAIFGYGIVRSGILGSATGWFVVVGSLVLLVAFAIGIRVPAIPIIVPAIIGLVLFFSPYFEL